jgi:hypothetical protein
VSVANNPKTKERRIRNILAILPLKVRFKARPYRTKSTIPDAISRIGTEEITTPAEKPSNDA